MKRITFIAIEVALITDKCAVIISIFSFLAVTAVGIFFFFGFAFLTACAAVHGIEFGHAGGDIIDFA